jgi:hypothetical protein
MAFTVYKQPNNFSPVFNQVITKVLDDEYTRPDYKYVFDIYSSGSFITQTKMFPRPDGTCILDLQDVLSQYIYLTPNKTLIGAQSSSIGTIIQYDVRYGAEYSSGSITPEYHGYNTGSFKYAWGGCANFSESVDLSSWVRQFEPTGYSQDRKILSELMQTQSLYVTDYRNLTFFTHNILSNQPTVTPIPSVNRVYVTTDSGKTYYKSFTIDTKQESKIFNFGLGVPQLNALTWTSGSSESINLLNDSKLYVQLASGSTLVSEQICYNLKNVDCLKYDHYQVSWYNKWGAYSYANLDGVYFKRLNTKKTLYNTIPEIDRNDTGRETKVVSNIAVQSWEFFTNWLDNQQEIDMYNDIITSPEVYIIDKSNNYVPVIVSDGEYDIQNKKISKLVQFRIVFDEAFKTPTRR